MSKYQPSDRVVYREIVFKVVAVHGDQYELDNSSIPLVPESELEKAHILFWGATTQVRR